MFLSAGVGHRLRGRMATASGVGIRGCTQTNAVTFHFSAGTTPSPPTQTGSLPPSPEAARPLQAPFPLPLATVSPIPVPLRHPVLSLSLFALIPSSPQAPRTSAPPPSPPLAVGAAGGRRHRVFSPSPPARWAWSPPLAMAPRWAWSPPSAAALGWLPSLSSGSRPAWRSTSRRQGWSPRHARRRRRARTWALADATANRPWLFFKTRPLSSGALVARAKMLVFCRLRGGPLWGGGAGGGGCRRRRARSRRGGGARTGRPPVVDLSGRERGCGGSDADIGGGRLARDGGRRPLPFSPCVVARHGGDAHHVARSGGGVCQRQTNGARERARAVASLDRRCGRRRVLYMSLATGGTVERELTCEGDRVPLLLLVVSYCATVLFTREVVRVEWVEEGSTGEGVRAATEERQGERWSGEKQRGRAALSK